MQQRPLGRSGLAVSRLALGTMTWGRDTDPDDAAAQLKCYLEAGGTLLDTADVYGDGDAESVIGSLLDHAGAARRGADRHQGRARPRAAGGRRDGSRGHLLRALDASLRRLGTDYVDLWQVHGYDPQTPLEETLAALDHAVTSGRVRYVGVSNFAGWQTARAAAWQSAYPGRAPIVAAQMEYSLLERGIERELLPAAAALGIGVLPWSPLGRGVLTGKYRNGRPLDSRAASEHLAAFVQPYLEPRSSSIVESVATAAARAGRVADRGGAGLDPRPARGDRADPRRPHRRAAAGRAAQRGADPAGRDRAGAGRRVGDRGRLSRARGIDRGCLRPLVQAGTYRRAVFLLLGAVILLPYVLLVAVLARMVAQDPADRVGGAADRGWWRRRSRRCRRS